MTDEPKRGQSGKAAGADPGDASVISEKRSTKSRSGSGPGQGTERAPAAGPEAMSKALLSALIREQHAGTGYLSRGDIESYGDARVREAEQRIFAMERPIPGDCPLAVEMLRQADEMRIWALREFAKGVSHHERCPSRRCAYLDAEAAHPCEIEPHEHLGHAPPFYHEFEPGKCGPPCSLWKLEER